MGLCLVVIALRMSWPIEFLNFMALGFGFYLLHGCIQVYVTELAPAARGSATAAHSFFVFLGQAAGPVVYGVGLASVGVSAVLLIGAAALAATGWICALQMRKPEAAS
jgi:predicted MFS family arabinose efflux permease